MRSLGLALAALMLVPVFGAPITAPNPPDVTRPDQVYAPPMLPRIVGSDGRVRPPFFYPQRLVDRIERRFEPDWAHPVRLRFLTRGRLVAADSDAHGPWLPLGGDSLGRDVLARLLYGGRVSLGVALLATAAALALGALLGGAAGHAGGWLDEVTMRLAELVVVLPILYVVLALRAALPLVLAPAMLFVLLVVVMAAAGWPSVARGVRAIVAGESASEYAMAARAAGASRRRVLLIHLLPAARGWLGTQAILLLPAFVLAEATLSFAGLGFNPPISSWGEMLREGANVSAIAEYPWVLAPGVALVLVVLAANLVAGDAAVESPGR